MKIIKNRNNDGRPKLSATEKKGYKVTVKFATAEYYSLKANAGGYTNARSEYINLAMRIDNLLTTMENDG